jgi:hypothetical protein
MCAARLRRKIVVMHGLMTPHLVAARQLEVELASRPRPRLERAARRRPHLRARRSAKPAEPAGRVATA